MGEQINDGGAAFPGFPIHTANPFGDVQFGENGMNLRDYFAAAAMQGLLANPRRTGRHDAYARDAWDQADAMIAARERKESSNG